MNLYFSKRYKKFENQHNFIEYMKNSNQIDLMKYRSNLNRLNENIEIKLHNFQENSEFINNINEYNSNFKRNYFDNSSVNNTENDRGITLLNGEGAYSGKPKRVIMCAVRPHQVYKITNTVKSVDKRAFIIVTTAGSIKGKGFITKTGIGS